MNNLKYIILTIYNNNVYKYCKHIQGKEQLVRFLLEKAL